MGNTKCNLCNSELWLRDEDAGTLIEELRICKKCLIKRHESRILHAKSHPRNAFFIGVIENSTQIIKNLNHTS